MPFTVSNEHLPFIAAGAALCGSGGGGSPHVVQLMLSQQLGRAVPAFLPSEIAPDTPCMAPAFAGSTMLLSERLPGEQIFTPLVQAAERWLGQRIEAVCSPEGGGTNALTPLLFAKDRMIIDADFSGRAVPTLDRSTLFITETPGLFIVCDTGASGIAIVQSPRAEDVEQLMRAAVVQAGGVGTIVIGGFTVGDLTTRAIHGHLRRSYSLGSALLANRSSDLTELAAKLGANLLGHGRIVRVSQDSRDPYVHTSEIRGSSGEVIRLVARSEYLAVLVDGHTVAASPDFIVAIDTRNRELIEVTNLMPNQHVAILTLRADDWWYQHSNRAERVAPSSYDLEGFDRLEYVQ